MIRINVTGGTMEQAEINAYLQRARTRFPDRKLTAVDIAIEGEEVRLDYHFQEVPFQRIRRITGYLVGTMDRWNDAKRAEERDRVKHI